MRDQSVGIPVEGPLVLRAGEVENTKKKSFLANCLKEKSAVVSRKRDIFCDGLFDPNL